MGAGGFPDAGQAFVGPAGHGGDIGRSVCGHRGQEFVQGEGRVRGGQRSGGPDASGAEDLLEPGRRTAEPGQALLDRGRTADRTIPVVEIVGLGQLLHVVQQSAADMVQNRCVGAGDTDALTDRAVARHGGAQGESQTVVDGSAERVPCGPDGATGYGKERGGATSVGGAMRRPDIRGVGQLLGQEAA